MPSEEKNGFKLCRFSNQVFPQRTRVANETLRGTHIYWQLSDQFKMKRLCHWESRKEGRIRIVKGRLEKGMKLRVGERERGWGKGEQKKENGKTERNREQKGVDQENHNMRRLHVIRSQARHQTLHIASIATIANLLPSSSSHVMSFQF